MNDPRRRSVSMSNLSASGSGGAYGGGLRRRRRTQPVPRRSEGGGPPPRPPAAPRVPPLTRLDSISVMAAAAAAARRAAAARVAGLAGHQRRERLHIARLSVVAPDGVPEWQGRADGWSTQGRRRRRGSSRTTAASAHPTVEGPSGRLRRRRPGRRRSCACGGTTRARHRRERTNRCAVQLGGSNTQRERGSGAPHPERARPAADLSIPPPPLPPSAQVVQLDASGGAAEANHDPSQGAAVAVGDAILAIDGSPLGDTPLR